jgi:hypothetical protein
MKQYGNLVSEHFVVLSAIHMWLNVIHQLTNYIEDEAFQEYMIWANYDTLAKQENMEQDVKQLITDFYNYFYVNLHICHLHDKEYAALDSYGEGAKSFPMPKLIRIITELPSQYLEIFITTTHYVFSYCTTYRHKIMDQPCVYDKEADENILIWHKLP